MGRFGVSASCAVAVALISAPAVAQTIGKCGFDKNALTFKGAPTEQAACLLTQVKIGGNLGETPKLEPQLATRVGNTTSIDKAKLKTLLATEGLTDLGASLDQPVSKTAAGMSARYFVIHDTSQKYSGASFPADDSASLNKLGFKGNSGWVAHAFINRKGEVLIGHDFSVPWRATRLENNSNAGVASRGLFLHIEHNQPRLNDPATAAEDDRLSPKPGFTARQYERSALLYITASARAGRWMIPAYHAVIDDTISGGHDDPQSWDRAAWIAALDRYLPQVETSVQSGALAAPPPFALRASLYYTALEGDYPVGQGADLKTRSGETIRKVSAEFAAAAAIEGSAKLSDGRVINVDGAVDGVKRWKVIPQAYGLDAVGCGLVPFRSAAVDPELVEMKTVLFLPETVGMKLPGGATHDGIWYAVDKGSQIKDDRIDLFVGAGKAAMQVPRTFGIGHLQALKAEKRPRITGCTPG